MAELKQPKKAKGKRKAIKRRKETAEERLANDIARAQRIEAQTSDSNNK